MKPLLNFFSCYLLFSLISCTSPRYIDVQVLNPAEVKLPSNIEKVFIISKSTLNVKTEVILGELYGSFLNHVYDNLKINLLQSPLFSTCKFYVCDGDYFINYYKSTSYNERKKYCVFNLDSLAMEDSVFEMYFNTAITFEFRYSISGRFSKFTELENSIFIDQKDTLVWEFYNPAEINMVFSSKADAYALAGNMVGEMLAHKMAPHWVTEERILFHNYNKYMRKAYKAYSNDNLITAISNWKKVYDVGTNHLASFAAYNIGVCYEILDDLDQCQDWLEKAKKAKNNKITENYEVQIEKRRADITKLNKQMLLP